MASFAVQKLLSLTGFSLFFFLISFALGDKSKNLHCFDFCQRVLHLYFLLGVLWFPVIFRSAVHFEFIFVPCVREYSDFTLLHLAVQLSQHHLLRRLSFLHWKGEKVVIGYLTIVGGFISGLSVLFSWSVCLFLCQYHAVLLFISILLIIVIILRKSNTNKTLYVLSFKHFLKIFSIKLFNWTLC